MANDTDQDLKNNNALLRRLADVAPTLIYVIDLATMNVSYVNRPFYSMLGYTLEEIDGLGKTSLEKVMHPDDLRRVAEHIERLRYAADGEILSFEYRMRRKEGGWRWFLSRDTIFQRNAEGVATHHIGSAYDITDRKQAEEALHETEERFRTLAENAPDVIARLDRELRYLYINPAVERYSIWPAAAHIGKTSVELGSPEAFRTTWMGLLSQVFATGRPLLQEFEAVTPNGSNCVFEANLVPEKTADGSIQSVLSIVRDVTERKRMEAALHEREELYRFLTESANDLIYLLDLEGRILYTSPSVSRQLGRAPVSAFELVHPDDRAPAERFWLRVLAGEAGLINVRVADADGAWHWLESSSSLVQYQGKPHILSVCRDVTDRLLAAESLRESEQRQRLALQIGQIGAFEADLESGRGAWTPEAAEIWGLPDDFEGDFVAFCWEHVHPEDRVRVQASFAETMQSHTPLEMEFRILRPDGEVRWVRWRGQVIRDAVSGGDRAVGVNMDVTDRKRLEEQLLQAQKLESIGRLAGGIAHDFNNLLTAILGYTELTLMDLPENDPSYENLQQVEKAANRAADLTRQLLAFARKQLIEPKVLDLNSLILELDKMLRRLIGEDIELVTLPAPDLWVVKVDAGQFQQVLINLCVNARDAMPQGGKLTIETANVSLDAEYARLHADVAPGDYVMLAVSDTGLGMDAAVQQHVFEPFFTTKGAGKGTGLGLATCHGIVKQSGGYIWLYSEPGRGTAFKIYLPRAMEAVVGAPLEEAGLVQGGLETILLVEDEVMVRAYAARALRAQGYTVLEAAGGAEALALAAGYGEGIDLLMTDVVMPQMSGRQLAEQLKTVRPGLKILYASGYTDNTIVHHGILQAGIAFLQKPYTPSALARKVRETLDADA